MKFAKKITAAVITGTLLTLSLTSCGGASIDDASAIADQMLADFNSGVPVYYTENHSTTDTATYIEYYRDADNNIFLSNTGREQATPYEYLEYRIGDAYYVMEDGVAVESATADYDPVAYFAQADQLISESIKFCTVDSFDPTIDTDFSVDGDNYVVTGVYDDDVTEYKLTLSTDGKKMTYTDETSTYTLDFNYSEKIELPN